MTSVVSICNQAITWLGGNPIISLDDGTTEAILCKVNFAPLRDAVMEEGKWTFATKRFKLLPNPAPPIYGYTYRFEIPSTVLVVMKATDRADNANDNEDFDYRREENFLVSNSSVIYIKALVQITDVTKFSQTFAQALAARIAADLAAPLTESTSKEEKMQAKYERAINLALGVDGQQGQSDRIKTRSKILRRR